MVKKKGKFVLPIPLVQKTLKRRLRPNKLKKAYQKTGLTPAVRLYYHKIDDKEFADPFVALLAINCSDANKLRENDTKFELSVMADTFIDEEFGVVYSKGFAEGWGARSAEDIEDEIYMIGYNDGSLARMDLLGDNCILVEDIT